MDDFEKKELDAEEEAVSETPTNENPSENSSEELLKELQEIRDMFQEAIDNAEQQETSAQELIQELDEIPDESEEYEEERPVCECCGEEPASALYGDDYPYCDNCRELMKHYPLRIGGVLAIIAMVAVLGLSVFFSMDSLESALVVLDARTSAAENKMMSTVQTLYSFTSNSKTDSGKAVELLVDGFIRTGYINNAKETIERYYTEDELNRPSNKKYKEIVDFVDNFLTTRDAVQDIVSDAFAGEEFDCDALTKELEEAKELFIDEENGIRYNAFLIEYYKYELLRISGGDLEKQLEILKGIEKLDENGLAEWIYVPTICEVACKMSDKELAEEYFERMKQINSEDMKAYYTFSMYYRYLETPDADAIIALCSEASENAYENDTSYYPALAIAYLLKGEGALALDTMTAYMGSNYYTVSNCNLYALCALYCGDNDIYKNMKQTLENSGFEMNDLVVKYKKGKLSVNEVLADMRGDIG